MTVVRMRLAGVNSIPSVLSILSADSAIGMRDPIPLSSH